MDILEGYGVGPRALCLLRRYWERFQMVERLGWYYGENFRGERGMTQGDPLSPTIFNVVVDTVVRHWESLLVERSGRDSSNNNATQPAGMAIWESDNSGGGRRWDICG